MQIACVQLGLHEYFPGGVQDVKPGKNACGVLQWDEEIRRPDFEKGHRGACRDPECRSQCKN